MTRSILLFFMFFTVSFSIAAQATLRGTVLDGDGAPLGWAI